MPQASNETAPASQYVIVNAAGLVTVSPLTVIVTAVSNPAMTALAVEVPRARSRAFRPFAEAVSVIGTFAMIRLGMAAYAIADPTLTTVDPITMDSSE